MKMPAKVFGRGGALLLHPWRSGLFAAAAAGLGAAALNAGCLAYLARAGCGQLDILRKREPLERVLADPATPAEVRERLTFLGAVRAFANERLGLNARTTFTTYARLDRSAVAWNVTAAAPLALEAHTWYFPIVGRVPYLGYYSRAEAEAKAAELAGDGYDVLVSEVAAYSTLGWFNDPLLSPQMAYSRYFLASLLIHESTHATLWFPGDVNFNESFASFVEREGAAQFFRETYGVDSREYRQIEGARAERSRLAALYRSTAYELEAAYARELPDSEKLAEKRRIIAAFHSRLRALAAGLQWIRPDIESVEVYNNAHFLSYLRYTSGSNYFKMQFDEVNGDWGAFFEKMRRLRTLSPEERRRLLADSPEPTGSRRNTIRNP